MEEKDDYDVFIEEAENVIEHYTAGEDVQYELNRLLERALLVDPINAPCRDAEAINAYNLLKRAIDTESPINIPITPIIRQRQRSHSSNDHNNASTNSPAEPALHSRFPVLICFIIFILLCLIYYLILPPPCPRPLW